MSLLIEAVCLVIRQTSLEIFFSGGVSAFLRKARKLDGTR
jgi:hypothetical protein